MRKFGTTLILSVLTLVLASALTRPSSMAARESCGCVAPDNSCSATGSCSGRCTAVCPSNGCNVYCSGFHGFLETEVTLQMQNGSYNKLVTALSRISGKEISFSSRRPDAPFNLDAKGSSMWDLLAMLSERGTVTVAGEEFEKLKTARRAFVDGEKVSMSVQGTPLGVFVADLANVSGLPIHIAAGDPDATVNVHLENVTLAEIIREVSAQTGSEIVNDDDDPNNQ